MGTIEHLSERLDAQDEKLETLYREHEKFTEFALLIFQAMAGPAADSIQELIDAVKAEIKTRRGAS